MANYLCPKCGKPVPKGQGCPRCKKPKDQRTNHGIRTADQERKRNIAESWRAQYSNAEYQQARQLAIAATQGRCAKCGLPVAIYRGTKWYTGNYGGVHHIRALSEGGSNNPNNLVLLCIPCHNATDAARRRNGA